MRKGCWKKVNACYWVADMIDSINANLNVFSPMRSENLDARPRCSHICVTSWWVSHVLLFCFPKCEIKMPLTKTKKIHRELRKNTRKRRWTCERRREEDRRRFFYGVKFILEKYYWERSVFALFVYLLIYFWWIKIHVFVFYSHFQIFLLSRRSRSHLWYISKNNSNDNNN